MNPQEATLEGTLRPDGTLELHGRPALAPGRVTVVLRPTTEACVPQEDWWQFMQQSRRTLEDSGARFMDDQEMNAHVDWLRETDHVDDLLRDQDDERA